MDSLVNMKRYMLCKKDSDCGLMSKEYTFYEVYNYVFISSVIKEVSKYV